MKKILVGLLVLASAATASASNCMVLRIGEFSDDVEIELIRLGYDVRNDISEKDAGYTLESIEYSTQPGSGWAFRSHLELSFNKVIRSSETRVLKENLIKVHDRVTSGYFYKMKERLNAKMAKKISKILSACPS